MAKPQNSPRGLFSKGAASITTLTASTLTTTGAVQGATLNIAGEGALSADGTGVSYSNVIATLPGAVQSSSGMLCVILNSTDYAIGINTTGTTWKFLDATSVQT